MKWIRVVDPTREFTSNRKKMCKFLYDTIREMAALSEDGLITNIEVPKGVSETDPLIEISFLSSRLRAAVRTGKLITRTDIWLACLQWHLSLLKKNGYIVTDRPYKPRRQKEGNYIIEYVFKPGKSCSFGGQAAVLYERFAGKRIERNSLRQKLRKEPSPTGKRTMWEIFLYARTLLVRDALLRVTWRERENTKKD
jgi:hypothetical protein